MHATHGDPTAFSETERAVPADAVSCGQIGTLKMRARLLWLAATVGAFAAATLVGVKWTPTEYDPAPAPLNSYRGYEWHPTFSPDGSRLAFTWNGPEEDNTDIYVTVLGVGESLRLTSDPGVDDMPAWSPDGRWIAFVRRNPIAPQGDIYVVPALGGTERKLGETNFKDQVIGPTLTWSPDGKWLIFKDTPPQRNAGLYRLSIETGDVQLFLASRAVRLGDYAPAFSPDGRRLAFCRDGSVYVVDLQHLTPRGDPRQLTRDASAIARSPAWTPDGEDIVFQRWMGLGSSTLWRVRADGSHEAMPVPNSGFSAYHPAISSRGRHLVYSERIYDTNIWRLPLRSAGVGAGPPLRLIASSRLDSTMAVSPDGRRVAFASTRSGTEQIWIANIDGSQQVQLTQYPAGLVGSPAWSPDGGFVAYDAFVNGNRDIFILPSGGGVATRLTTNAADDRVPSWSADGRWIYFSSDKGGRREVWKKAASGSEEVQVTQSGGFAARETPDGRLLCYFTSASEGLWIMPLNGGVPDERHKQLVAKHATFLIFDVSNSGIYFGDRTHFGELSDRTRAAADNLYYYDFAMKRTTVVAKSGKELSIGISVSRDERFVLFSQVDVSGSDLMIVDKFR
jgi:Tol biopolymer transport system component